MQFYQYQSRHCIHVYLWLAVERIIRLYYLFLAILSKLSQNVLQFHKCAVLWHVMRIKLDAQQR